MVDDFELTIEMGRYSSPSDITFTKDGTLWACNKRGILLAARRNNYGSPREILDLRDRTCENGERGLLGVAPHPDFGEDNPFVYLIYTFKKNDNCRENGNNGPVTRLSRFTCDAGGDLDCDAKSEEMFLESPSFPFDHHNSGAIKFGKDGLIYATIGDGGESPTSQDRSNLFGTVVRMSPDNTVPPGNPYSDHQNSVRCGLNGGESGSSNRRCQEIFAYGLRNPFRMAMNPNKGKTEFHINDVGASLWEEVSVGGDGFEGANYGWPIREGPCRKGSDCGRVCRKDDEFVEPIHFYHHDREDEGAITGGAFVPNGAWPSEYDGEYLYADYVFGAIFHMKRRGNGDRDSCPLKSDYEAVKIVDFPDSHPSAMAFNPRDDALYFLTRGFGGRLNRVRFVGETNRPPQAVIRTSAMGGEVGTTIEFDATASTDPDGHDLEFEWDFDGDGEVDSTESITSHKFNEAGIFEVTLQVRDGKGGRPKISVDIGIGAHAVAEILVPAEGATFVVGEEFLLTGSATGDGIGNEDSSMKWEVRQHHANHYHPFLEPEVGNRVPLQAAPSPEDFLAANNSFLKVILTVTNEFGLETTVTRDVMPEIRQVEVLSVPAGRTIKVDDFEVTLPATFNSWPYHPLKLEAIDGDFRVWSNGGDKTQVVSVPESVDQSTRFVAYFGTPTSDGSRGGAAGQVMTMGGVGMSMPMRVMMTSEARRRRALQIGGEPSRQEKGLRGKNREDL